MDLVVCLSVVDFLEPPCFSCWFGIFWWRGLCWWLQIGRNFSNDWIWEGCLYVCFECPTVAPNDIRTTMATLHILPRLPWQFTPTPWAYHVRIFKHHSSSDGMGGVLTILSNRFCSRVSRRFNSERLNCIIRIRTTRIGANRYSINKIIVFITTQPRTKPVEAFFQFCPQFVQILRSRFPLCSWCLNA